MRASLAAVILAHRDVEHVRRLIGALDDVEVLLHWDAKADTQALPRLREGFGDRVGCVPRHDTRLASWSLVAAELTGLRLALERTAATHIAVMSGSDYPLLPMDQLRAELAARSQPSWVTNRPLPYPAWDVAGFRDGGLWRHRYYFPTFRDQIIWVGPKPLFVPWRRGVHPDLEPRAASHWKILARDHVQRLLSIIKRRPDLVQRGRHMFIPEETFLASIMASPRLFGEDRIQPCHSHAWYIDWPADNPQHPRWLDVTDFETLRDATKKPEGARFARKVSSAQSDLLDRIDDELRQRRTTAP